MSDYGHDLDSIDGAIQTAVAHYMISVSMFL